LIGVPSSRSSYFYKNFFNTNFHLLDPNHTYPKIHLFLGVFLFFQKQKASPIPTPTPTLKIDSVVLVTTGSFLRSILQPAFFLKLGINFVRVLMVDAMLNSKSVVACIYDKKLDRSYGRHWYEDDGSQLRQPPRTNSEP
jgi:hypothetical protein